MAGRVRAHDWSTTPLGPIERWPQSLRFAVDTLLAAGHAMQLAWGPERTVLYNDAYAPMLGERHPAALGIPFREAWPEIWGEIELLVERVFAGETVRFEDMPLVLTRNGYAEDIWWTFSYSPLRDETGTVVGLLNVTADASGKVRAERERDDAHARLQVSEQRQTFLLELSDALRPLTDTGEITAVATRLLGERLGASRVYVVEWPSGADYGEVARDYATEGLASLIGRYPIDTFRSACDRLSQGRTWIVEDAAADDGMGAAERRHCLDNGMAAWIDVPLVKGGQVCAALCLVQDEARRWTASDSLIAEATAERCWAAIERARAEAGLRASEEQRRVGLEGGGMGAWQWDVARGLIWGDAALAALWGLPVADAPVHLDELVDRIAPRGREELAAIAAKAIAADESFEGDLEFVAGPTRGRWVRWRGRADPQRPTLMHGVSFDVTERRVAEAALRESEERYRSAARVGRIGSWETDFALGVRRWSREGMALFGLDIPGGIGRVGGPEDEWRAALHPDERDLPARIRAATGLQDRLQVEYRVVHPGGEVVWVHGHAEVAARDAEGHATRLTNVAIDVTERRLAEQALRHSEERFRSFAENSADTLWIVDADSGQLEYLSPAFERTYGEPRDRIMADIGRWATLVHPDDRERVATAMPRLLAGETSTQTYRVVRPSDGEIRHIQDTGFPISDDSGRVRRVAGVAQDLTERTLIENQVRESRRRLRALVEGMPQLVWRAGDGGDWTWSSPQWSAYTGLSDEESRGLGWLAAVHPDDRERTAAAWHEAERGGIYEVEYRISDAVEGRHRWFSTRAAPVRDEGGVIVEWLGTSTDIDDLRRLQEEQHVLVAELQHRTRNLIAVVRSVAEQTMAGTSSTEDFRTEFNDRLAALSRVQGLLSRAADDRITIRTLLEMELDALGGRDLGDNVVLDGPEVLLRNSVVQTLALALHELATNARKHGALATETGRLQVTWRVQGLDGEGRRLALEWVEQGSGRLPGTPAGTGYGRELIERALPYALDATTRYELDYAGVRCSIDLPLAQVASRRISA